MKPSMILAIGWLLFLPIAASAGQSRAALQSSRAVCQFGPSWRNEAHPTGAAPGWLRSSDDRHLASCEWLLFTAPRGASRYFCVFHNEAFVSRIGMIDHLSSMHGVPLTTAASLCPDADGNCIFPLY